MIGIVWNCRGLGRAAAIRHLRSLISSHQPDFIFLSETKCNSSFDMSSLSISLSFDRVEFVPSRGTAGGLVLMWHDVVNLTVIFSNENIINCVIQEDSDIPDWQFTCLYDPPVPGLRAQFWDSLADIGTAFTGPWNIIGDFNALLSQDDKKGGRAVSQSSNGGFRHLINTHGLIDLGFQGHPFTWSNRRRGVANIQE